MGLASIPRRPRRKATWGCAACASGRSTSAAASSCGSSLDPTSARKAPRELVHPHERKATVEPPTERELAVLRLLAQGLSNAEIAERLVITEATARTQVSNILGKLHLASRTQAALYALREGLASLDASPGDPNAEE